MTQPNRWLGRSGQRWKLLVSLVLILMAAAVMALLVTAIRSGEPQDPAYAGGLLVALASLCGASMAWLTMSIRCARCGHRPVWKILRTQPAADWLAAVVTMDSCPNCRSPE